MAETKPSGEQHFTVDCGSQTALCLSEDYGFGVCEQHNLARGGNRRTAPGAASLLPAAQPGEKARG